MWSISAPRRSRDSTAPVTASISPKLRPRTGCAGRVSRLRMLSDANPKTRAIRMLKRLSEPSLRTNDWSRTRDIDVGVKSKNKLVTPKRRALCRVLLDFDAQGLEELQVLIADFEFGIAAEGGDQGSFVGGFVAGLADADGGFEHQKNVVAAVLDTGDDFGNLVGVGQRLVDRFAKFLHELLEFLVHESSRMPEVATVY